jgi:hypothetical protein
MNEQALMTAPTVQIRGNSQMKMFHMYQFHVSSVIQKGTDVEFFEAFVAFMAKR